jgi:hypothetical protein
VDLGVKRFREGGAGLVRLASCLCAAELDVGQRYKKKPGGK